MAGVELRGISKDFGAVRVLQDIDISVRDGEFLTLVGPSGCGKSTLIRIIAGLEHQSAGSVMVDGRAVDHLRPHERRLSMVFQSYALYPHMTVFDNIAVPLAVQRLTLVERLPLIKLLSPRRRRIMRGVAEEVRNVASQLQIEGLLGRKPAQLSGGQRQRVALGRAMVRAPAAFLMDEPLSNLDAKLRVHMRTELTDLHQRMGATFIYVTHDQVEAMTMSDRVAMMKDGIVQQLGTPAELYARPANLEVARFIGSPAINTVDAKTDGDGRMLIGEQKAAAASPLAGNADITIGVRPEALFPRDAATPADWPRIAARLHRIENLGSEFLCHFDLADEALARGAEGAFIVRAARPPGNIGAGGQAELTFDPAKALIFDHAGRLIAHGNEELVAPDKIMPAPYAPDTTRGATPEDAFAVGGGA